MSLSLSLTPLTVKIPEDILLEILARLSASSVTRFKRVSKLWYSLISSRYFTNIFFKCSTKRERRVFVYTDNFCDDYMLFSSSLIKLDAATSLVQLNRDLTLPCMKKDCWELVNAIRGLMCFRVDIDTEDGDSQIRIINFTTRQVLSLPLVESNMFLESDDYYDMWNYFGYDPVNDQYKVLSTISSTEETNELRSETQVFVLGDGGSWRNTKSLTFPPPPHDPHEGGIFINDVLYYGARSHEERSVLMTFDFSSEEFHLIELPLDYRIKFIILMNYQDQVALLDCSGLNNECILDLWVLEDAGKSKWSHKFFILPCDQIRSSLQLEDMDRLWIRGTSRNGEVMLRAQCVNWRSTHVFYELENNHITRGFVTEPPWWPYPGYDYLRTDIWDDAESIMYLEA